MSYSGVQASPCSTTHHRATSRCPGERTRLRPWALQSGHTLLGSSAPQKTSGVCSEHPLQIEHNSTVRLQRAQHVSSCGLWDDFSPCTAHCWSGALQLPCHGSVRPRYIHLSKWDVSAGSRAQVNAFSLGPASTWPRHKCLWDPISHAQGLHLWLHLVHPSYPDRLLSCQKHLSPVPRPCSSRSSKYRCSLPPSIFQQPRNQH